MQLEATKMFLVNDYYYPEEVNVIKRDGKVFLFSYSVDDEYNKPCKGMVFFDTKEAANKYHSDMMSEFDIKKIKDYIQFVYYNNVEKLESILPDNVYDNYKKGKNSFFSCSYLDEAMLRNALNGILNIDGISFRVSDISQVKYGEKWLSVILKDGKEVTPKRKIEVFVIESIFGNNNSGMCFKGLDKPMD